MTSLESISSADGPTIVDLFRNPNTFHVVSWCVSIVSVFIALVIFMPHYNRLKLAPNSYLKRHVLTILLMAPVYAVTALLALFFPRSSELFAVLRSVVESWAIYAYVGMLLDLLGGFDKAVPSIQQVAPSGKFYAVPPFGCCFRPCCPVLDMNVDLIRKCRRFGLQAVYAIPTLAYLHLWVELERAASNQEAYSIAILVIQVLQVLSVMVAFYGMMILYFACRRLIESYNPTKKMLSIKLVLFVGVVQGIVLSIAISKTETGNADLYDDSYSVTAWTNFLLCLESAPLALLMRVSYPEHELYVQEIAGAQPTEAVIESPLSKQPSASSYGATFNAFHNGSSTATDNTPLLEKTVTTM